jgi:thiol-disulfide isomerase/thioredoxin
MNRLGLQSGMPAACQPRPWLMAGLLMLAACGCAEKSSRNAALAAERSAAAKDADASAAEQSPAVRDPFARDEAPSARPGKDELAQAPGRDAEPAAEKRKRGPQSDAEGEADEPDDKFPYNNRIPAPELAGGVDWINTGGPLHLADLKGKFVLLDFWTYCCINCMHILPELKKLEHAYPNQLVVVGVHSATFDGEQDSQNIADAVQRYDIEHPVINDANHAIWNRFGISSWPTVLLIDPEGNLVWGKSGEVEFPLLDAVIKLGLPYYREKGALDETPLRFDLEAYKAPQTALRFPGKVLADEASERLFIADSNHHRIVISKLDGTLLETIGSGELGAEDGDFASASFKYPQGMVLRDQTLYVADTENHLLRKIDLQAKKVVTIAGVGRQGRMAWPGLDATQQDDNGRFKTPDRYVGPPLKTAINSPWDLWIHDEDLYIAMAGPHQIWKMPLDESEIGPYAGNGREDIVDGPLLPKQPYEEGYASFAQPSGLTSDGEQLFVADSEGSSIRAVPFDPAGKVTTVVGTSHLPHGRLFHFGDADGQGRDVLLQHALGVAFYRGRIYVADTYNNKVKVVDPEQATCKTLAGTGKPGAGDEPAEFDEPAGITAAAGKLYVADTNNHLIRVIDLDHDNRVSTLALADLNPPAPPKPEPLKPGKDAKHIALRESELKPQNGAVRLSVKLQLPEGYKINPLAPMSYQLSAADAKGPVDRKAFGQPVRLKKPAAEFEVDVPLTAETGEEELKFLLNYYYCQEGGEGLCKVGSAVWTVPITLSDKAEKSSVPLQLKVE